MLFRFLKYQNNQQLLLNFDAQLLHHLKLLLLFLLLLPQETVVELYSKGLCLQCKNFRCCKIKCRMIKPQIKTFSKKLKIFDEAIHPTQLEVQSIILSLLNNTISTPALVNFLEILKIPDKLPALGASCPAYISSRSQTLLTETIDMIEPNK